MVQVGELRIGSYVRLTSNASENEFEIVDGLASNKAADATRCIHLAGNGIWNYEKQLSPIPLTSDILEKCGFENLHNEYCDGFRLGAIMIEFIPDATISTRLEIVSGGYAYVIHTINSLHQLQNLYFSLTNTELTIKL